MTIYKNQSSNVLNNQVIYLLFLRLMLININVVDETDAVASTSSDNQGSKEMKNKKAKNNSNNEEDDKKKDSEINEESNSRARKRTHKQKARLLPQKDVYKSAQQDFTYVSREKNK